MSQQPKTSRARSNGINEFFRIGGYYLLACIVYLLVGLVTRVIPEPDHLAQVLSIIYITILVAVGFVAIRWISKLLVLHDRLDRNNGRRDEGESEEERSTPQTTTETPSHLPLTRLKGIGPKRAERLYTAGYRNLEDLMDPSAARKITYLLRLNQSVVNDWIKQAKELTDVH